MRALRRRDVHETSPQDPSLGPTAAACTNCTPPTHTHANTQTLPTTLAGTVEDFKKCAGKAGNPYNFPFVSDCVGGSSFSGPCKDSATPVACGDGTCKSDYVSCLRSLSHSERGAGIKSDLAWAFRNYEASPREAS